MTPSQEKLFEFPLTPLSKALDGSHTNVKFWSFTSSTKFCYLLSLALQGKFTSTEVVSKLLYYSVEKGKNRLPLQKRVYPDFCELREPQSLVLCSVLNIRIALHGSRL